MTDGTPSPTRAAAIADAVLERVEGAEPGAEAEVNVSDGRHALTRFANSFIHQNVGEEGPEVMVRVALDGKVAGASTSSVDADGLRRAVEAALAAARLRPEDPDWPGLARPAAVHDVEHYDDATAHASPAERAAVVGDFVEAGPGLRAAGYCDTQGGTSLFANTAGQRSTARGSRATLDGIHQAGETLGAAAGKGHATSAHLADLDGAAVGATSARTASDSADATDLEPGRYEVILEPECVAEIMAFLALYGFNAKQVIEEQSFVRLGEHQFDDAITIVDDVTDPRAIGVPHDVEGTPKRRLDLVRAGRTVSLTHDRRTARKAATDSTGHAIPGGERFGAVATNLFLTPGDATIDAMVQATARGILVTEFNYCRILDPKTQVVTGLTRNGTFLIENGKVAAPLKNLRFTQSFVEALAPGAVKAVSSDARMAAALFGPGMAHVPSVHLASWNFTGGAQG
jgi:predicted Zn-dependent protease